MCVVSNVTDYWRQQPQIEPFTTGDIHDLLGRVTRAEFDSLKKQVEELRELIIAAKKFDESTGQPNCEMAEKVELVKKFAEALGVDMSGVF